SDENLRKEMKWEGRKALDDGDGDMLIFIYSLDSSLERGVSMIKKKQAGFASASGYPKETMGYYFYFLPENKIVVASMSKRTHRALHRLSLNVEAKEHSLGDLNKPTNYKVALSDLESNKWLDAINLEMQSMKDNLVWHLVDLNPNDKTVGSKWLFKKKTDMDDVIHTYKAHLVAKAIPAFYDYEIWKIDVKTAFLNGYLYEDVYMVQPEGFVDPKHPIKVCKLQRSICRLKKASRSWNKRFDEKIKKSGYTQNIDETCVYQKASGSNVIFLILYVDDILIMGNHILMLQDVKSYLGKCFAMKDIV
ncbi:retrotransposon protein, putative, ty1-copia subclass, partial [Tanacetum coccineum]